MKLLFLGSRPDILGPLPKVLPPVEQALSHAGCDLVVLPWGRTARPESVGRRVIRLVADLATVGITMGSDSFDALFVNTSHDWRTLARDIPLLALAAVMDQRRRVLVLHGSKPQLATDVRHPFALATRLLTALCTHILVLSSEEAAQWGHVAPHRQVQVIRLPRLNVPAGLDSQPTARAHRPTLIYAGRLLEDKGIFDLLEALKEVVKRFDCEIVFAGVGPDRDRLGQRARALNLEEHISCTGYLDDAELWRLYKRGTGLVLPTRMPEGFPVVILEALEAGLPVITTCIRGAADWLRDGINGFFVPSHDPPALADAICKLLANPTLVDSMRIANRELVHSFDADVVARIWLDASASPSPGRDQGQRS